MTVRAAAETPPSAAETAGSSPAGIEAPSGKDAAYENFPVGSFLLPPEARPHVAVFYRFARAIDDIADSAELGSHEKLERLEGFARGVRGENGLPPGYETAMAMHRSLAETDISQQHCLDLIDAFKQDSVKNRTQDWDDLMHYCIRSAAPVGRYLLDLHGGMRGFAKGDLAGYAASDALCNALQVINHLQDCQDDLMTLDRAYLPDDWLAEEGGELQDLRRDKITPELRRVVDRCLDGTEALLLEAATLPGGLVSRRLAMESAAILEIAWRLVARLRVEDPLPRRVKLSKAEYIWCCLTGVVRELTGLRRRSA